MAKSRTLLKSPFAIRGVPLLLRDISPAASDVIRVPNIPALRRMMFCSVSAL
jgi:hypothetical protein